MPCFVSKPVRHFAKSKPFSFNACASAITLVLAGGPTLVLAQVAAPDAGDTTPAREASPTQRVDILARQGAADLRRAASVAKQIYGREELDKYGDNNVLDVMRRLPGVNVGQGGPRMRGLGSGYTQILINGDPAPPGFQLDQLNPAQVERIEVLRAPTADTSAQAVAGTINIILKEAPRKSERQLRLGLHDGLDRPQANLNLTFSEAKAPVSFTLPLSLFEWQRENRNTLNKREPGTDGLLPATFEQVGTQEVWGYGLNVGPRLNWKISDEQTLGLSSFAQKGRWNNQTDYRNRIISGLPVLEDDTRQNGSWQNVNLNGVWNYRFDGDQRIELRAGARSNDWTFDLRNQRQGVQTLRSVGGGDDDGATQAGKYSRLLGEAHSLTVGWDLEFRQREEQRTSTRNGLPLAPEFEGQPFDAKVQRRAFYIQDEWEISPQWQTVIGLRQERISTRSAGSSSTGAAAPVSNTSSVLSPLWHVTWKLDPKGRDMVRASLARTYRAPNISTLLARPNINNQYADTTLSNTELSPDRIGNPALKPELSTGLDIAFEKYLQGGAMWSLGVFHRQISGLTRSVTTLQPKVAWATAPRWVAQPLNFSKASTSGIEFEIKGNAAQLVPALLADAKLLNLRASVNFYRSSVAALPGPDNRLDGQQPWSTTLGFDQRINGLPLNIGGSLSFNPRYDTQLTLDQTQQRSRGRTMDFFAQWVFKPGLSARFAASAGVQPFGPPNGYTRTVLANGDYNQLERYTKPNFNVSVDVRL